MAAPDKYAAAEAAIKALEHANADKLFSEMDVNGNGVCSLAEIDKWVVERWPVLNNKPALMRAYHATIDRAGPDADAWVDITEFNALLVNLFVYNKVYDVFSAMDTDRDRRITLEEFVKGAGKFGLPATAATFGEIDTNHGGMILFDEFCAYYARRFNPAVIEAHAAQVAAKPKKAASAAAAAAKPKAAAGAEDPTPDIHTSEFDALETEVLGTAKDAAKLKAIWAELDDNGNGSATMAEVDAFVKKTWPSLHNVVAVARAFKITTKAKAVTSITGIRQSQLPAFLANLFYFNKLNLVFSEIDADGDHRLDFEEFFKGLRHVGLTLPVGKARQVFNKMDEDKGGFVQFDEFCDWVVKQKVEVD